ncbi:MAG: hypothetical protein ACE5EX_12055, partial [Phycisphaerae bacterium]
MNRYIQWYTANYRADFYLEPIPADTGDIGGFVWNDELHAPNWSPDGIYRPDEERTLHGVTVELYESDGVTPVYEEDGVTPVTTTSGAFDSAATVAQGWREPYTMPLDEFGGVYVGPLPGYYEFRDLAPGDYVVKVIVPDGFFPSPTNSHTVAVTVTGGDRVDRDFGLNTLVPQAGEIEGGVFDDIFVDSNPDSLLFMEKAGIPGVPVGVYDHLGYFLGSGTMGNPLCYSGSTVCPPGEEPIQKPEMERRFAPGVHIYVGNDSSLPGYNANYLPLVLPYEFSQGQFKFEADWSLVPAGFGGLGAALQGDAPVVAGNRPVVDTAATAAAVAAGEVLTIHGEEFGPVRGYGTVTLSGRQLDIVGWGDTEIRARIPADAIGGPLLVANSTGVSNGMSLTVTGSTAAVNAVYVDASSSGTEDGTSANPWSTIGEALDNLPAGNPRYVFVAPGTYYERPHIAQSDVYIIGAGPHETTVDGNVPVDVTAHQGVSEGGGPVFFIGEEAVTGPVENVMISGLTITHGSVADDIGAGIFAGLHNRGIDINNNMIVRNGGYYGGG